MGELEAYQEKLLLALEKLAHTYERNTLALVDAADMAGATQSWRKFQGVSEAIETAKHVLKLWKAANG